MYTSVFLSAMAPSATVASIPAISARAEIASFEGQLPCPQPSYRWRAEGQWPSGKRTVSAPNRSPMTYGQRPGQWTRRQRTSTHLPPRHGGPGILIFREIQAEPRPSIRTCPWPGNTLEGAGQPHSPHNRCKAAFRAPLGRVPSNPQRSKRHETRINPQHPGTCWRRPWAGLCPAV